MTHFDHNSVRVGNELGAGNPKSAAFSVVMVTLVSLTITVIKAIMVLALRHVINYVFTSGETVANAVSGLCPYWQSLSSSMESNQSCPVTDSYLTNTNMNEVILYADI